MGEGPAKMYAFAAVFSLLPMIAVALRFYARYKTQARLLWDDFWIVIALLGTIATAILLIVGTADGYMGQHMPIGRDGKPIYDHGYWVFQKMMFGNDLSQMVAIGPTKISVLLFYRRVFPSRKFGIASMILIILSAAWTIAFFFANLFQNDPVNASWTMVPAQRKKHINQTQMYLAQSYADVVLDVLIISLPIPKIWTIQMPFSRKLAVSFIFLLGIVTTAASITRTVIQYGVAKEFDRHNPDTTYYLAKINYWPLIEASLGIVGACLPMLGPIGRGAPLSSIIGSLKKRISQTRLVRGSRQSRSSRSKAPSDQDSENIPHEPKSSDDLKWQRQYDMSALESKIGN